MTNDAPLLLDATRLIWRRWKGRLPTGIDRVCLAYLHHFAERAQAVIQHDRFRGILNRKASAELFELLAQPPGGFRNSLIGGVIRNLGRIRQSGQHRLYLNIGHTGLNAAKYRTWCADNDVRPVYLIHDLIPITHPEYCRAGESEKHRQRMRTVLSTAHGVIGNSQVTIDDLAAFAAQERLPMPPHVVAWLGSNAASVPATFTEPDQPTFVILGTIEGRKNHEMLLRIWERLIDRLGSDAPRLLIIGQRGWEADAVFSRLDRSARLRTHVVELNRSSDAEIAEHMQGARALLFPSLVEGFGLPLVEALGAGVPVIASDLPVFREIAGDLPDYIEASDEAAWERMILDYASLRSDAREAQRLRIRGFEAPTWSEHFTTVEAFLASLN